MRPLRLYIEDFMCYDHGFIDFTDFSSALIVGKRENNDMYSNGVGKTTIFKAIEYVLFNEADTPLEKIIRDDANRCQIVFDFMIGDQEYRLSRSRTRKGSSDLTLLQRNGTDGSIEEVYHTVDAEFEKPFIDKKEVSKYWKDLSGSRAGDTEKDLAKLIKTTHKAFVSTVLFPQNDMSGLPTATPEKRKAILKDGLNLLIYSKLEKLAKDKSSALSKEIDKTKVLVDSIGDPEKEILDLTTQLSVVEQTLTEKTAALAEVTVEQTKYTDKVNELTTLHSTLESKFASLVTQEKTLSGEKSRLEISVKEYQTKRANVTKAARELVEEVAVLKEQQTKLIAVDYSEIDIVTETINTLKEELVRYNHTIKTSMDAYEELKTPLPSGSKCKHCRKPMTDQDREDHQLHIAKDMALHLETIKNAKEKINLTNKKIFQHNLNVNSLNLSKKQLEEVNTKISSKNKEIQDKRALFEEYSGLLEKFQNDLKSKSLELETVRSELKNSSLEEAQAIQLQIDEEKKKVTTIVGKIATLNKEITHYSGNKAVIRHTIEQKVNDKAKKETLTKSLLELEGKVKMYPSVIQAFSSTGIPNLIIQNVLDDLQVEANTLLAQLKPGLQLSFFVEKTKGDGDQADTLDIQYHINGKERYYKQLSGGMQLAVAFSLKLGFSFLLQKMIGTDIRFLLLDEIDQSLDKASVDSFADIVKFFHKDFTILIITHNDRLKDKFSHAILVEQDINMVSRARVVSSW